MIEREKFDEGNAAGKLPSTKKPIVTGNSMILYIFFADFLSILVLAKDEDNIKKVEIEVIDNK